MSTVVPFVMGAGDDIARAISGQSTVASQLDQLITQINAVVLNLWQHASFTVFGPDKTNNAFFMSMAEIIIIAIGTAPFIIISLAYLLIAKVMVCLLLAVGSIFICMAFFPATRDNFKSWSGQCLNYIFLTILYSVAFSIEIALIQRYAGILTTPTAEIPSWNNALELCIIMLGFAAVTMEIPSLASHLAGGVGISGLVGNSASKMMMGGADFAAGKLMGAGKMGGKMAGPAAAAGIQAGKQAGKFAGKVANAVVSKISEMGTKA
jgi:type IV secretion system protein VirB6